ncbi:MAG: MBL fold metallo-hydrolase [Gammaproteobacteria bacterium]|nr:MBL fold metallo-hydrolase [Gammaproteobacteria bacterium]MYH85883.1 MBL fold metallo-hydrolase [Gammaproteobacteria bacterium]MYK04620.1 MBL fold metallo-hydrolase [Gammaproteobacteria bacterium]
MQTVVAGVPERISECEVPVFRILGRNPGPMTGPGTNSYLIGESRLSLIDPGPRDGDQLRSFLEAIGDRKLEYILATHTHGDHSPGAAELQRVTGAELVGLPAPEHGYHDLSFTPGREWRHGDLLDCGEYTIRMLHTPGHVSNHFCFLLCEEQLLFTGDHVLQGTTSVILPPDGNMSDYLDSLEELQQLPLRYLAPGHGNLIHDPHTEIGKLVEHRMRRESKIERSLAGIGTCTLEELVVVVYDDVDKSMHRWAERTMLAHLEKLEREGRARRRTGEKAERWSPM